MKNKNQEDISERPSGKLVLIVMGSVIAFFASLIVMAVLEIPAVGYFVFSVYFTLGLVMVFRSKMIGTAIYRANLTMFIWVWRNVLKSSEEKVQQRITRFKANPLHGYKYHLVITFIIGLVLVALSIWSFIMIYQGKFY
jgi:hypothetical protein